MEGGRKERVGRRKKGGGRENGKDQMSEGKETKAVQLGRSNLQIICNVKFLC